MTILKVDTVSGIGTEGTVLDGDVTFDSLNYMTLPKGTTTQSNAVSSGISSVTGAIRYNTDSNKMECFDGTKWWQVAVSEATPIAGRAAWGGGTTPTLINAIEYISIATGGNAVDFGDLTVTRTTYGSFASRTRGVFGTGRSVQPNTETNTLDYITFASAGNATDFGDAITSPDAAWEYQDSGCVGSNVRGLVGGGASGHGGTISYFTIASTGNGIDFGDLTSAMEEPFGLSNATRALFGGNSPSASNLINYVTIATTGNAVDFGDNVQAVVDPGGAQTATRGFVIGSYAHPTYLNNIQYITIATTGNSQDFGDMSTATLPNAASAPTRICYTGCRYPSSDYEDHPQIEMFNPVHQGNAIDFGDISNPAAFKAGISNAHGGL